MPTMLDLGGGLVVNRDKQLLALDRIDCEESLAEFVRHMWHVIEPATPLKWGWSMDAICEHLEAVAYGDITRLLINVSPGSSKSILCNVFYPAWIWARDPYKRFLSFSYAAHLTERDNRRFRDVIQSVRYQAMFGERFSLVKKGEENVSNNKTGFKIASSVGGVSTGERSDTVILDDPHSVKDQESDVIRKGTVDWFSSAMSNRLNDMEKSSIICIMQRVHEEDVSGYILDNDLGYEHLCIPALYEPDRRCVTAIGWEDPRDEVGQSFWPERFPIDPVLNNQKKLMGDFGFSGQYQQLPSPADGGIIKKDWWQMWEDAAFPPMDYILASLDTAYTEKTENDYSALTVWGVFSHDPTAKVTRILDADGKTMSFGRSYDEPAPKLMMMFAWQDKLAINPLVTKVAELCKKLKVDVLLIENKAAGHSVAQEIRRLFGHENWGVILSDPKSQDKVSRLYSVQHIFQEKMVYAPDRAWADMVIDQIGKFPKGRSDDLVDTVSMSIRRLRDMGLLTRAPERQAELNEARQHHGKPPAPLY